jgi:hypothetical protein
MTILGGRKVNRKGRSTGALRTNRRTKIGGQFAARTIEMLESAAFRVLSLSARRVLDRLEIELAHHGGQDNGKLPVTFDHFQQYGMHRQAIAPGIRECVALGFVEITRVGARATPNFGRRTCSGSPTSRPALMGQRTNGARSRRLKAPKHWRVRHAPLHRKNARQSQVGRTHPR